MTATRARSEPRDWYRDAVATPVGAALTKRLGLPRPVPLRRYEQGQPLLAGPAVVVRVGSGPADLVDVARDVVRSAGGDVVDDASRLGAVVVDATGVAAVADLAGLREALAPAVRGLLPSGRVVVLTRPPLTTSDLAVAATRRAVEGAVRSLGKELRAGATANLLYVADGAGAAVESPLRFLLSARSAYVSGQAIAVSAAEPTLPDDWAQPLAGRVAVVTGAARGIGAAISRVLARDGATVVCVDVPAQGAALAAVANDVGGSALQLDITAADAPDRLALHLAERHGGVDVVVHNAGITRDRLLVNMDAARWESVLAVNLEAQLRIDAALLDERSVLRDGGRLVRVASTSGIAGNRGQTNYAASKAGVIGLVEAQAPLLAERGVTVNAVAPGFIETEMTARMPFGVREAGRRVNSMGQGGLPVDVAETVAWLAQPATAGVTGQVVRVCGQSMVGA